jgi:hypothetical protein
VSRDETPAAMVARTPTAMPAPVGGAEAAAPATVAHDAAPARAAAPSPVAVAVPPAPARHGAPAAMSAVPRPVAVAVPPAPAPARRAARRVRPAAPKPLPFTPKVSPDLATVAQQAGADVRSGPGFMEISFPPPPTATGATLARATTRQGVARATDLGAQAHDFASGATHGAAGGHGHGSSGGGGASDADGVVDAVLRQLRLDNEHLGLLDGFNPLF